MLSEWLSLKRYVKHRSEKVISIPKYFSKEFHMLQSTVLRRISKCGEKIQIQISASVRLRDCFLVYKIAVNQRQSTSSFTNSTCFPCSNPWMRHWTSLRSHGLTFSFLHISFDVASLQRDKS